MATDLPLVYIVRGTQHLPFPEPSEYMANTATMVDGGRNVEGNMIGTPVRHNVAKIEMSWRYLTVAQWAEIIQFFNPVEVPPSEGSQGVPSTVVGGFINQVGFFDQSTGDWTVKTMYVSDRSSGMWRRDPETGTVKGWLNCKLSLIEV